MKNAILENIATKITDTAARLVGKRVHIDALDAAGLKRRDALAIAMSDRAAAIASLAGALSRDAAGMSHTGEADAARLALKSADKAIAALRVLDGETEALMHAQREAQDDATAIEAEAADLKTQQAEAIKAAQTEALIAEMYARKNAYTADAAKCIQSLAQALALNDHLDSIGLPQDLGAGYPRQTVVGLFAGDVGPNVSELIAAERRRLAAEFAGSR